MTYFSVRLFGDLVCTGHRRAARPRLRDVRRPDRRLERAGHPDEPGRAVELWSGVAGAEACFFRKHVESELTRLRGLLDRRVTLFQCRR